MGHYQIEKRAIERFKFSEGEKLVTLILSRMGTKKFELFIVSTYLNHSHRAHLRTTRLSLHN